jgi:hypothetical protein
MKLDASELSRQMILAGADAFGERWEEARVFAEIEFRTIAARLESIAHHTVHGLDSSLAGILLESQKRTAVQAIAAATALTLLAVEAAFNAVLAAVRDAVNAAIGFTLL